MLYVKPVLIYVQTNSSKIQDEFVVTVSEAVIQHVWPIRCVKSYFNYTVSQKTTPFYFTNNSVKKLADFNNFLV